MALSSTFLAPKEAPAPAAKRVKYLVERCGRDEQFTRQVVALAEGQSHVDPDTLLAMIVKESCLDPKAVGGAALGLTQVIPKWNMAYIKKVAGKGATGKDLFKPEVSVEVGAQILSANIALTGSEMAGLQAYNAGPNAWAKNKQVSIGYAETVMGIKDELEEYKVGK